MEDRIVGINLVVDGISFPLTVPASEEPYYRQAARMINETLILYKQAFAGEGSAKLMSMVALDLAYKFVKQTDNVGSANMIRKINELSRIVDDTLNIE